MDSSLNVSKSSNDELLRLMDWLANSKRFNAWIIYFGRLSERKNIIKDDGGEILDFKSWREYLKKLL